MDPQQKLRMLQRTSGAKLNCVYWQCLSQSWKPDFLQLLYKSPGDKVMDDRLALKAEIHFTCAVSFKLLNYVKSGGNGFQLLSMSSSWCWLFKIFNLDNRVSLNLATCYSHFTALLDIVLFFSFFWWCKRNKWTASFLHCSDLNAAIFIYSVHYSYCWE